MIDLIQNVLDLNLPPAVHTLPSDSPVVMMMMMMHHVIRSDCLVWKELTREY